MLRRLIVVLACSLATLAAFGQVATPPQKPSQKTPRPPGNCAVSGRVVSAAEGTPLRSARVALIEANQRKHPLVYAATTDNDGRFEIKQVDAGRYDFFVSKVGYLEQHYQSKGPEDEGATLSLSSAQTVDDAMFRMVRAGVITGRVVDDIGEPMMGVNVSVLRKPTEEEREQEGPRGKKMEMTMVSGGSTDDRGEYRIFSLKPGEYFVKAAETGEQMFAGGMIMRGSEWEMFQELGGQYAPIYYPGVLQIDQAQAITLSAGEESQADFAMRKVKMVEVAGHVIGPDGGPATRVWVQLSQAGIDDWGGQLGASVDSSGEFSIKSVPPGSYFINAQMREKDKHYSTRQRIEVGEAKIEGLVLSLGAGAVIHGRIRTASGAPPPSGGGSAVLQRVNEEEDAFAWTEINKDGTFEFNGVADGGYTLRTYTPEQGWFVKSAHLGNEDVLQNGVQVDGGAVKGSLDVVVSNDGAQIEGTVTEGDKNQPLAGVQVKVRADPETDYNREYFRQAATDQNGHFVVKDIRPGKYKVSARMPKSSSDAAAIKSEAVPITLGDRDHRVMDFKLTLPKSD